MTEVMGREMRKGEGEASMSIINGTEVEVKYITKSYASNRGIKTMILERGEVCIELE